MSATVAEALRAAAARLADASDTARLDAEVLMAHALGVSRSEMLLRHSQTLAPVGFAPLVDRRARHEPVAYIVGRQEFYGLDLAVTPDVLIPRADSEALIEAAREVFAARAPKRVLDLGTGSGALLLAALALWPGAEGVAIDRSPEVLGAFAPNAQRFARDRGRAIAFEVADWRAPGWAEKLGAFDLVLCNPPYVESGADLAPSVIEFEPAWALFAGAEGLDDYRVLVPQLPRLLTDHGAAVLEIGATQADQVAQIAAHAGFSTDLRRDLGGRPRALVLRRS